MVQVPCSVGRLASLAGVLLVASLESCGDRRASSVEAVSIGGSPFMLEIAAAADTQDKGLAGRDVIAHNGGMIFIFPEPQWQSFVMRDCVIPLDIAYLDPQGRVVTMYTMAPEPPRGPTERAEVPEEDAAYNARLKSYPSSAPATFVIELRGETLQRLGVVEGDLVKLDAARLLKLVR